MAPVRSVPIYGDISYQIYRRISHHLSARMLG